MAAEGTRHVVEALMPEVHAVRDLQVTALAMLTKGSNCVTLYDACNLENLELLMVEFPALTQQQ